MSNSSPRPTQSFSGWVEFSGICIHDWLLWRVRSNISPSNVISKVARGHQEAACQILTPIYTPQFLAFHSTVLSIGSQHWGAGCFSYPLLGAKFYTIEVSNYNMLLSCGDCFLVSMFPTFSCYKFTPSSINHLGSFKVAPFKTKVWLKFKNSYYFHTYKIFILSLVFKLQCRGPQRFF